jgi:hypothetical protein
MDLWRWLFLIRGPLEIVTFGLALSPLMSVSLSWSSLPKRFPVHFGVWGRPDRWVGRARLWVLPVLALLIYGVMNQASGTWEWLLYGRADLSDGAAVSLLLKPLLALLMVHANEMSIRVARSETDAPNSLLVWGLMMLLVAPPLALTFRPF